MARTPIPELHFHDRCGDCGERRVELPKPLPPIGDDFDWLTRDYDGFRLFMMEELAGRFPERRRWTPADIEVILIEAFAVVLDQMSDQLDRAYGEAFLETARRPESVLRLLGYIGYDALRHHHRPGWADEDVVRHVLSVAGFPVSTLTFDPRVLSAEHLVRLLEWAGFAANALGPNPDITDPATERDFLHLLGYTQDNLREVLDLEKPLHRDFLTRRLLRHWRDNPYDMDQARQAGPRAVHTNHRMVSLTDYRERLEDHPLVLRAASDSRWTGSWQTVEATVVLAENGELDFAIDALVGGDDLQQLQSAVDTFHWQRGLAPVDWTVQPTFRSVLRGYLEVYRMAGQEVWLRDAVPVGLSISLSVRLSANYFQSEVRMAITEALGTGPEGFFEPGRLAFGEDLFASDLIEWLMRLDGIEAVCLNRFKRVGDRYPDQSGSGIIRLNGLEIARCDNIAGEPEKGYWRLKLHGGQPG
ncbi:hypothetical protein [Saccharospirillum salsuginis]|uniref:Uncharacterized protein n=1 Tax=Saccharospirillum salsuginis TaxID=418750 RepID=A0A918JZQ2_9GAMM|nr:hypothetical protein [Saccharospirillum salsuginis]GGX39027.1 hypothetical protein GCM10007392_01650 [Saccharospirillum salsuginis]